MMTMGDRIRSLRKSKGWTQDELAEMLGMDRANVSNYERGTITNIKNEILHKMAEVFGTSIDYIVGRTNSPSTGTSFAAPALSQKEEHDIKVDLERILANLESDESLAFNGEEIEMDEEAKELLRMSLEQSMRLAKQLAKKKFTPKRYRDDSEG